MKNKKEIEEKIKDIKSNIFNWSETRTEDDILHAQIHALEWVLKE